MGSTSLAQLAKSYTAGQSGTSLALAGASVATTFVAAQAQRQQAELQSTLHRFNAKVAEETIKSTEYAEREEQRNIREMSRRVQGDQAASIGASGFTFQGQRSVLIAEAARDAERDAQISRQNFANRKSQLQQQAQIERFRAKDVKRAGKINQFATLISGAVNTGNRLLG